MTDMSEKQEKVLEDGELQFVSPRWGGKTLEKQWSAHVFDLVDLSDCPMCVTRIWPPHGSLVGTEDVTVTFENGSVIYTKNEGETWE